MFNNIGVKIKTVAMIVTWIGIVTFLIVGGICMGQGMAGIGFLIMLIGSLVSWLSSFLLYGFGQLIENTDIIAGRKKTPNKKEEMRTEQIRKASRSAEDDVLMYVVQQYENGEITEKEYLESLSEMKEYIEQQYANGEITKEEYDKRINTLKNLK